MQPCRLQLPNHLYRCTPLPLYSMHVWAMNMSRVRCDDGACRMLLPPPLPPMSGNRCKAPHHRPLDTTAVGQTTWLSLWPASVMLLRVHSCSTLYKQATHALVIRQDDCARIRPTTSGACWRRGRRARGTGSWHCCDQQARKSVDCTCRSVHLLLAAGGGGLRQPLPAPPPPCPLGRMPQTCWPRIWRSAVAVSGTSYTRT
jgi:hypothetical protein